MSFLELAPDTKQALQLAMVTAQAEGRHQIGLDDLALAVGSIQRRNRNALVVDTVRAASEKDFGR